MTTTLASNAQQQQPGAAAPEESGATSADRARAPNKEHEHGVDHGAGKQAIQPCPQADAASKPPGQSPT